MKVKSCLIAMMICAGMNPRAHAMGTTGFILPTRYYDAAQGRFISADSEVPSAKDPQSLNRYSYVRNNPMVLTDPTGHSWLSKQVHKINSWADKNPWGAFVVQQFSPIIGTALLTRTETGRNIIAGEIIVGTAVGTAGIGGPMWSGALSGELVGGYSAYRADGSILSGVAVGGVVGAGTGYLGAQAGTATRGAIGGPKWLPYTAGGAVRGSIMGAGVGGVAGYRGGRGNFDSVWAGVYRGAAVGAALGGTMGYFETPGGPNFKGMTPDEALRQAKIDVIKGAQNGNVFGALAKDFGTRAMNTMAEGYTNAGYALVSDMSGVAEIYHHDIEDYLDEHGININGSHTIKF